MIQPKLFEKPPETTDLNKVILYALGDFQSRGKALAGRQLPLDRLHGAFVRAFDKFGIDEPPDELVAEALRKLGVEVREVLSFVAKRPFRVTVPTELAERAAGDFRRIRS